MSKRRVFAQLVVFLLAGPARASVIPTILIDYARVRPREWLRPPPPLLALCPSHDDRAVVSWVVVRDDDSVKVGVYGQDGMASSVRCVELARLKVFEHVVAGSEELQLMPETIEGLRERRHEVPLAAATLEQLRADPRVASEIAGAVELDQIRVRFVERLRSGGARLHVSGDGFSKVVEFEDLDDFNRTSGLRLEGKDFWRDILSFWRVGAHEMSGGFVMKSRAEAGGDCARALRDVGVSI